MLRIQLFEERQRQDFLLRIRQRPPRPSEIDAKLRGLEIPRVPLADLGVAGDPDGECGPATVRAAIVQECPTDDAEHPRAAPVEVVG